MLDIYIYSDAIYNILSHVFLWHVCVDVCISLVHIRAPHMAYRIKMSSSAVHVNQGPVSCCNDETKNRCTSHPHGGLFMDFNQPDLGIQPTNIAGDTYILYIYIYTYLYIYIQHCENTLVANCDPWKQNGWSNLLTFADYPGNYLNMRASVSVFTGFLQTFNQKPVSQNISLDSTEKHRPWSQPESLFYTIFINIQYSILIYSIFNTAELEPKYQSN